MATVTFEKLTEHTANIKGTNVVVWRVRLVGTIDEYYVRADKAHSKLGGGYWTDTRYLIALNKVQIANAFETKGYEPHMPANYQEIICGQCGITNSLNIDTIHQNQGAHYCKSCKSTIAVVTKNNIQLKNGSKGGNVVKK